jgi:hypothetical protein
MSPDSKIDFSKTSGTHPAQQNKNNRSEKYQHTQQKFHAVNYREKIQHTRIYRERKSSEGQRKKFGRVA